MATFVLIAGAFHGGWAWTAVDRLLTAAGHEVHRLDLAGQGARARDATAATDLDAHVRDVVDYLEIEDLKDVVLVGHSYSGMVVTGAADRTRRRVGHLVYLDAMVPSDGERAIDIAGPAMTAAALAAADGGWRVPFFLPV